MFIPAVGGILRVVLEDDFALRVDDDIPRASARQLKLEKSEGERHATKERPLCVQ